MGGWIREIKLATRSLAKQPGMAVLAIVTLALGIGANTAIFSVIEGTLLRPLPYADPDGLVRLSDGHQDFGGSGINQSIPNLLDLRAGSSLLEESAIYTFGNGNLAADDRPERVRILYTSSEMLRVLGVTPQLGRDLLTEDDVFGAETVAILSDEAWRTRFGADPGIVGQTTTLDSAPVRIVGVAPSGFTFPFVPELIMALQHEGGEYFRGNRSWNAIGRLAPGAELAGLQTELQGIFSRLEEEYPGANEGWYTAADPLRDWAVGQGQQSLYLLAGAVTLVLLIACVNVANLLIVRADNRRREFAIRYAMGARRTGLIPHFLSEGLVLALLGGGAGLLTAMWGIDLLVALYGGSLQRSELIGLNGTALAFGVGTSLIVGIVVGLVPLLRIGPLNLHEHLKEGARGSSTRLSSLGTALVISVVALAVLIVSGAGLLTKSIWQLQRVDLGVLEPDRVLTLQLSLPAAKYEDDAAMRGFYEEMIADLERTPGIQAAGLVNRLPLLGGYNITSVTAFGDPDREARFVSMRSVTPGYFEAVGVPLLSGRWLSSTEFSEENIGPVLINETLARQVFAGEDPLGQRVDPGWNDEGLHVVGVVGDIMGGNPTRPAPPAFYFPMAANVDNTMGLLLRTAMGDPVDMLPTVRESVLRLDSEVPVFQVRTLEEIARSRLGTRRFAMSLFGVFAGLALLLGAIGVYGVMSFAVTQRARELGVRLALGASRGSVLRMVLSQGVRTTLPGVFVGLLLALASSRALRGLLYEVSELDPWTYATVAVVLTLVSVVASGLPAYRATRVDPLTSIRNE